MAEPAIGRYLYCVLPGAAAPPLDGLVGVDGAAPVEPLDGGGLRALSSRVPLDVFGEQPLRRNLERIEWVERTARAHDAVLARALAGADAVVPLRMFTIFADERQARAMLERERSWLAAALERLRGVAEWGVKARVDEARLAEAVRVPVEAGAGGGAGAAGGAGGGGGAGGDPGAGGAGAATPGHAFFARRRADAAVRERAAETAASVAEEVHRRLAAEAADATLLAPQRAALSGLSGTMVLNGAYLVPRARERAFAAAVEELAARHRPAGFAIDLSGPWAPYSFAPPREPSDEQRPPAPRDPA